MKELVQSVGEEYSSPILTQRYSLVDQPDLAAQVVFSRLALLIDDPAKAHAIAFKLHHNSSDADLMLGNERPKSVFYYIFPEELIIDSGQIGKSGEAAIHGDLRRFNRHKELIDQGASVRSGHIGLVTIGPNILAKVALIDSLYGQTVETNQLEYPIIATLIQNGFLPITSDGFPVATPWRQYPTTAFEPVPFSSESTADVAAFVARLRARKAQTKRVVYNLSQA